MLLSVEQVTKSYGDRVLLDGVSFYLERGDKVGIIGVNGAGKSTLLRLLAGAEEPDGGTVRLDPGVRMEYLPQNPVFQGERTVLEQVLLGLNDADRSLAEYEARTILNRLGVSRFEQSVGNLSGGERRRVALAAVLARPCDVLILDEPTNHLDNDMVLWLEDYLRAWKGALVMVTHDRYFLERIVGRMAEVEDGRLFTYEGNYDKYLERKAARLESERASERKRQAILRREYQWVMQGPTARGTKSRERLERYEALKAQSGPAEKSTLELNARASRLGKKTIECSRRDQGLRRTHRGAGLRLHAPAGRPHRHCGGQRQRQVYPPQPAGRGAGPRRRGGRDGGDRPHRLLPPGGARYGRGYPGDRLCEGDRQPHRDGSGDAHRLPTAGAVPLSGRGAVEPHPQAVRRREAAALPAVRPGRRPQRAAAGRADQRSGYSDPQRAGGLSGLLPRRGGGGVTRPLFPGPGGAAGVRRGGGRKRPGLSRRVYRVSGGPAGRRTAGGRSPKPAEPKAARPQGAKKLKFSYKEQREFETIDADIAALEAELAQVQAEQEEKATDYVALQSLQERQAELEAALEEKMERWVYLNDLAEQISNQ